MNPGNCFFSHAVYWVSKTTLLLEHAVDFVIFSDEKVFTVASPLNLQNDRIYAPSNAKKHDIAPERLLRCRPKFLSLIVSVAVSKLGCTELFFVKPGVKVDGRYYCKVLLKKQMLPVMHHIAGQCTVLARQFSCCSRKHHSLLPPLCGLLTVRT